MLRNNDVLHLASKYQTILYGTVLANAGLMLKKSWLAPSSEQILNYFIWDQSNERWTNAEGIMTSPLGWPLSVGKKFFPEIFGSHP